METLYGAITLNEFPPDVEHVTDLIYSEGPVLSVWQSKYSEHYVYLWQECEYGNHRWLVCRVSNRSLLDYFHHKITLRDLVLECVDGFYYVLTTDKKLSINSVVMVLRRDIPKKYIPSSDSYFDMSLMKAQSEDEPRL